MIISNGPAYFYAYFEQYADIADFSAQSLLFISSKMAPPGPPASR
jgi:hypothetical protein